MEIGIVKQTAIATITPQKLFKQFNLRQRFSVFICSYSWYSRTTL